MAVAVVLPLASEAMIDVSRRQRPVFREQIDNCLEVLVERTSVWTLEHALVVTPEQTRELNLPHSVGR